MNPFFAQAISPSIEGSFLGYGIVGAVALVTFGIAIYLYRDNKTLQAKINELNEKRVEAEVRHATEVAGPLTKLAEQSEYLYKQAILNSEKRGN